MSFFEFSESNFDVTESPIWDAKDVVRFLITDFSENAANGTLAVRCKILNTKHEGRTFTHWIRNDDNEASQKQRVQFSLAFWTKEELLDKTAQPSKLIGRCFTAQALQAREYNGKWYQSFIGWKDEGPMETDGVPGEAINEAGMPAF